VKTLNEDQFAAFERDGYLPLGTVVGADQLGTLRIRMAEIIAGTVGYAGMMREAYVGATAGAQANRFRKIGPLWLDPLFLDYIRTPLYRQITQRYYGPGAKLQRFMLFNNFPREENAGISYHQDGGDSWNWAFEPHPFVTLWLALDAVDAGNGCVHIFPGSHRELMPLAQVPSYTRGRRAQPLELNPGEAALLHNWTIHGSSPNRSERQRQAVTACFAAADTRRIDGEPFGGPTVF
jgi:phytanoyl-CoA hydroxylase